MNELPSSVSSFDIRKFPQSHIRYKLLFMDYSYLNFLSFLFCDNDINMW